MPQLLTPRLSLTRGRGPFATGCTHAAARKAATWRPSTLGEPMPEMAGHTRPEGQQYRGRYSLPRCRPRVLECVPSCPGSPRQMFRNVSPPPMSRSRSSVSEFDTSTVLSAAAAGCGADSNQPTRLKPLRPEKDRTSGPHQGHCQRCSR
jgi:hypothetical protein